MFDRSFEKGREQRAIDLDGFDAIGRRERAFANHTLDLKRDRASHGGVELRRQKWTISVALTSAEGMRVGIESDHGLNNIFADLDIAGGLGKLSAFSPTIRGSPGRQSSASTAKKGWGLNQFGPNRGSPRLGLGPSMT